jgi:hypothetical protein
MAFKIIYLAKRNPKIAPADFPEMWRSHSRLASTLVNTMGQHFARVRQCIKIYDAKVPPEYVNEHDGSAVLTMKSWDGLLKARYHKDAVTTMRDDEPRVFADYVENYTMAAEESPIADRREGTTALLHFVMRRPEVDPWKFFTAWNTDYVGRIMDLDIFKNETVSSFAVNRTINTPSPAYNYAGISELWFDDEEKALAAAWDEKHKAVIKSLDSVIDPAKTAALFIRLNFQKKPGAGLNP